MEYLDVMLVIGLELKQQDLKWERVVESIRKNIKSNEFRSSLITKSELIFKVIREHIRKWNMVEDYVSCYVVNKSI